MKTGGRLPSWISRVTTKGCLGAIACPPSLLNISRAKEGDQLHLIHFESDRLCSWKPGPQQMRDCCTSFTHITNEIASYKGHFGPDEHDYSHWMALNLPNGSIALRVLLFIRHRQVLPSIPLRDPLGAHLCSLGALVACPLKGGFIL